MNPWILLVEDDPTSRAFLQAATEALPARVDTAASVAEALALACANDYALWLVDANLLDGSGIELLAKLRGRGFSTPAVAHTASREAGDHRALRARHVVAAAEQKDERDEQAAHAHEVGRPPRRRKAPRATTRFARAT